MEYIRSIASVFPLYLLFPPFPGVLEGCDKLVRILYSSFRDILALRHTSRTQSSSSRYPVHPFVTSLFLDSQSDAACNTVTLQQPQSCPTERHRTSPSSRWHDRTTMDHSSWSASSRHRPFPISSGSTIRYDTQPFRYCDFDH